MSLGDILYERKYGSTGVETSIESYSIDSNTFGEYTFSITLVNGFSFNAVYNIADETVTSYEITSEYIPIDADLVITRFSEFLADSSFQISMLNGLSDTVETFKTKVDEIEQSIVTFEPKLDTIISISDKIDTVVSNVDAITMASEMNDKIDSVLSISSDIEAIANDPELVYDIKNVEENSRYAYVQFMHSKAWSMTSASYANDYGKAKLYTYDPVADSIIGSDMTTYTSKGYEVWCQFIAQQVAKYANNPEDNVISYEAWNIAIADTSNISTSDYSALHWAAKSKKDKWISEAHKMTANSYSTEPEDVLVKIYTSNGDGTFSYTDSNSYSSLHWALKSQQYLADGLIDDTSSSTEKTYSSYKINQSLSTIETDYKSMHNSQQSDINSIVESILNLTSSSAQGEFGSTNLSLAINTTERVLPFNVITQSTATDIFEITNGTGIVKEPGAYRFISTVEFEDTGANGDVATVTFNLRDTTTDEIYYTQSTTVEISNYDRETIPFNSLLVVTDEMTLPVSIDINVVCSQSGYSIVNFKSLISATTSNASIVKEHNSLVSRDAIGSHPASAISNSPSGDLEAETVQDALDELQTDISSVHLTRADKYLSAQVVANMLYTNGKLTKVQYNNATDVDYEVLSYVDGKLTTVDHYTDSTLKGTTTLSYVDGKLVSAIFVGV